MQPADYRLVSLEARLHSQHESSFSVSQKTKPRPRIFHPRLLILEWGLDYNHLHPLTGST